MREKPERWARKAGNVREKLVLVLARADRGKHLIAQTGQAPNCPSPSGRPGQLGAKTMGFSSRKTWATTPLRSPAGERQRLHEGQCAHYKISREGERDRDWSDLVMFVQPGARGKGSVSNFGR